MNLNLLQSQDVFLFSTARFPAMISAIGTGKTMCLLLKCKLFCETYPNTLALIIRKEYTDLRDSTISDFEKYFNVQINVQDKSFTFPNGSKILFRHGAEMNVLKNLNLSFIGIEQAEEFEDEKTFDFLRDRLRRQNAPIRQLCIIANARGHNWIWQRWIGGADEVVELDTATGQFEFRSGEYHGATATSFANEKNLPDDFIADLRAMEQDSPNHYQQFVMNSFEELEEDDLLFKFQELNENKMLDIITRPGFGARIGGFDIARYGNDKCSAVIIEQKNSTMWEEIFREPWVKKDLMDSTGRIIDLKSRFGLHIAVIDGDGMGAGVVDRLKEQIRDGIVEFRGGMTAHREDDYSNRRTEGYMTLKDMIQRRWMKLKSDEVINQLMTIRFRFDSKGRKHLLTKEQMKKHDMKSPDDADALMMAVTEIRNINKILKINQPSRIRHPGTYQEADLFKIGGIK